MRSRKLAPATIAAAAIASLCMAAPASAAPGGHGNGVGGCIDHLYGNATNPRPSGNGTYPSQSPGPFVNNPANPKPRYEVFGPTVGNVHQAARGSGLTGREVNEFICKFP